MTRKSLSAFLFLALFAAATAGACGGSSSTTANGGSSGSAAGGAAGLDGGGSGGTISFEGGDAPNSALVVTPQSPTLTVTSSASPATLQFKATEGGAPVTASWSLDRAEIGKIDASGLFTAAGVAGTTTVTATSGGLSGSTTLTVVVKETQNGVTGTQPPPGPGGYNGVGGEGLGPAVSNAVKGVLDQTPSADPNLTWLYPYDKTVFPLGLLAPLLQWNTTGPEAMADGIRIHLTAPGFDYKGYFAPPAPLPAGQPFIRHPIPQDVWAAATQSAAGKQLTVELVVAKSGTAYGPISETWTVANGLLQGTVFYQSYGTNLAHNFSGTDIHGNPIVFGGATLAIQPGATSPVLVAGSDTACRVCHTVSADGSRMLVQQDDNEMTSSYDLTQGFPAPESPYPAATRGELGWSAIYPDGSVGLSNGAPISAGTNPTNTAASALYDLTSGNAIATTGLSTFVTHAGMPAFSPDGKHLIFNFWTGPGDAQSGAGDGTKLVVMDFDAATHTFSNARVVYAAPAGDQPGWPTFMPDATGAVFELETSATTGDQCQSGGCAVGSGETFSTRCGSKGELWWTDVASGQGHELAEADGKDASGNAYLPADAANGHDADTELNFEPTVATIPAGGYAWIVFTSRRMYGTVASMNPYWSDPRCYPVLTEPTPKKLWVAAIDLDAKPGADPSHPAFYLPGQELLAGNSRGYWVQSPCKQDGATCQAGVECCGGYCEQDPKTGAFTCGQTKTGSCSPEYDKCQTAADCCGTTLQCINQICEQVVH
jgi:hypothetical protein